MSLLKNKNCFKYLVLPKYIKRILKIIARRDVCIFPQINVRCIRLGTEYGGYCISLDNLSNSPIVYSFGVGEDISFDLDIIDKFDATVFAFDPTPRSISWLKCQHIPMKLKVYEWGLADYDGEAVFRPPFNPTHVSYSMFKNNNSCRDELSNIAIVHKISTIMQLLEHIEIDILKMDIEGAEYAVISDIVKSGIKVNQILVEFHAHLFPDGLSKTRNSVKLLNEYGMKIFHISPSGKEYSFSRQM